VKVLRGKILVKESEGNTPYGDSGLVMPVTNGSSTRTGTVEQLGPMAKEELEALAYEWQLDPHVPDVREHQPLPYAEGSSVLFYSVDATKVPLPGGQYWLLEPRHILVVLDG
jgi:co-chaperonin GroES (HSP10)